jgi:nucleoside-diphosphate-sugar epimerase
MSEKGSRDAIPPGTSSSNRRSQHPLTIFLHFWSSVLDFSHRLNDYSFTASVRELASQEKKVVVLDCNPDTSYIADSLDKVKFVYGDVANMAQLAEVMAVHKVNVVFHLGYMLVPDTDNRTGRAIQVNCAGFQNVMEAARVLKVRRVVWASSQVLYGFGEGAPAEPISEDIHVQPTTQYGNCK